MSIFAEAVLDSRRPLALPIAVYPGLEVTRARVLDIVTNAAAQAEASAAIHQRYRTPFALTARDLSLEAEAFGCEILWTENEIPTATGRVVSTAAQVRGLRKPEPGEKRTGLAFEVVRRLKKLPSNPIVLAGAIGPFSLAARLLDISEALQLTVTDPGIVRMVLEKSSAFLIDYVRGLKSAGASGVIMAEPTAGLLFPAALKEFSSQYVRQIVAAAEDERFTIILHNCGARGVHLASVLDSGARAFHFGAAMDLGAALAAAGSDRIFCGNLDPSSVFARATAADVAAKTQALLSQFAEHHNFLPSSGCDLPPGTPLENLDAFFETVTAATAVDNKMASHRGSP